MKCSIITPLNNEWMNDWINKESVMGNKPAGGLEGVIAGQTRLSTVGVDRINLSWLFDRRFSRACRIRGSRISPAVWALAHSG
ncbi:MAG: hypothetical protein R3C09_02570 [Pirellulaceae bacterium]